MRNKNAKPVKKSKIPNEAEYPNYDEKKRPKKLNCSHDKKRMK